MEEVQTVWSEKHCGRVAVLVEFDLGVRRRRHAVQSDGLSSVGGDGEVR